MEKIQQERGIFDEEKMNNILQVTEILTEDGQRELALDLLAQTIRRCELEAQGKTEDESKQLDELRATLEERYRKTYEGKIDVRRILWMHFAKIAITAAVIIGILLIGALIAGGFIISKANNTIRSVIAEGKGEVYQTLIKGKERLDRELDAMDKIQRIRIEGLLTYNPAVYYKLSVLKEEQGYLEEAIEDMEFALGLIEPDKEVYQERLRELKNKLENSKEETSTSQNPTE